MQTSAPLVEPWPAPAVSEPIRASLTMPGSKSVTNRALILAALADGLSTLHAPLRSRDTQLMVEALQSLGIGIVDGPNGEWRISPHPMTGPATVDCGLAGTVMRFVPPLAALAAGQIDFDGDPHARKRPMSTIINALRTLGATIDDGGRGALPFAVLGNGAVPGGSVTIDASASSQFVSGLLLSAPRYRRGVTVHHDGKAVPSLPHIEMTVSMLRAAGAVVDDSEVNTWRVVPGRIRALNLNIEPDLSNAAPFLAAALVTGGTVTITGWPQRTTQPGDHLRGLFTQLGGVVELNEDGLTVSGGDKLVGIDVDLRDAAELTPVIAAIAALADSPSRLRGVAHIRGHETDRLAALANELNALGGAVTETEDGLEIQPKPLHSGVFATYNDHRMAQAGALLGLAVPGISVENIATTSKTMPNFTELWTRMVGGTD